jgi:hypothetical protein
VERKKTFNPNSRRAFAIYDFPDPGCPKAMIFSPLFSEEESRRRMIFGLLRTETPAVGADFAAGAVFAKSPAVFGTTGLGEPAIAGRAVEAGIL